MLTGVKRFLKSDETVPDFNTFYGIKNSYQLTAYYDNGVHLDNSFITSYLGA
jgi:hypothetical protein